MESGLRRAFTALAYWAGVALRSPREGRHLAKTLGACALDIQFDHASPFPSLKPELISVLQQYPVNFPPPRLVGPGNQDFHGLVYLVSLAKLVDARHIFEIGTYNGFTALTLARNVDEAVVHTLDLPPDTETRLPVDASDMGHIRYLKENPRRVYGGTPEEPRIVQYLEDSAIFDFTPFESKCDLVYIDGAHSFDYVKTDTESAFRVVSGQGVVVWDDYRRVVPDVPRYLNSLARTGLVRLPGSRLVAWLSDGAAQRLEQRATVTVSYPGKTDEEAV